MVKALLILAWRDDVGAYILHSYPVGTKADGQDLMNLYNLHRFRSTDKNFQMVKRGTFNAASYYSGGYQSNYIGKPNYCITLLLEEKDNPMEYEKVLIKVTNNLLTLMDKQDFDLTLQDTFIKLRDKKFNDIKVTKGEIEFEEHITEGPAPKKKLATTSSSIITDEEKIFADLMDSQELGVKDTEHDKKMADFEKSMKGGDPFAAGNVADPFGGSAARDKFAENPFDAAQKPKVEGGFGFDETVGKTMFEQKKTTAADIVSKLDAMDKNKPPKPADADKDKKIKYLEELVAYLEEKVKILGTLANSVKSLEKSHDEKDQLIGKLLLLLKGN